LLLRRLRLGNNHGRLRLGGSHGAATESGAAQNSTRFFFLLARHLPGHRRDGVGAH
jgi:hypothetical protein